MSWQEVEQEISAIPKNGPVLDEFCKLLEAGEAIALAGPGTSAELWPMRNVFLEGLLEHARQCKKINQAETRFFQQEAIKNPLETIQQLHGKIGDKPYFDYIQETFNDKISPQTGETFTIAHKALLQLPVQNYLTLCYDAGLTNARAYLYPRATTSYYFWDQEEVMNILENSGFKRLILHAHGRYDRSSSMILTLEECRKAYGYPYIIRLLNSLFMSKTLILIGFEPNCPYITQLLVHVIGDYKKPPFRHIALIGLDAEQIQVADLLREREEMTYGAQILFYPNRNNHEALAVWLAALAEKYAVLSTIAEREKNRKPTEEVPSLKHPPPSLLEFPVEKLISVNLSKKAGNASFTESSEKQEKDYVRFEYQCYDMIHIPGTISTYRSNLIVVNENNTRIGDSLFALFLRLFVELKKGEGGWVNIQDLYSEGIINDPVKYQIYSRLRTAIQGNLLEKDGRKFVQSNGTKEYRISTHPDFITYNREKLITHKEGRIRELAQQLP